jgi:hypothetical protein
LVSIEPDFLVLDVARAVLDDAARRLERLALSPAAFSADAGELELRLEQAASSSLRLWNSARFSPDRS